MVPGQECLSDPVVRIGDRCLIGKGSGIVGHFSIEIGNDVWTGHHVYITDQNHGYDDIDRPISQQTMPERPVEHRRRIVARVTARWCCPGRASASTSPSVPTRWSPGELPDYCVAVGNPARVIRRYVRGRRAGSRAPDPADERAQASPPSSPGGDARGHLVARLGEVGAAGCVTGPPSTTVSVYGCRSNVAQTLRCSARRSAMTMR